MSTSEFDQCLEEIVSTQNKLRPVDQRITEAMKERGAIWNALNQSYEDFEKKNPGLSKMVMEVYGVDQRDPGPRRWYLDGQSDLWHLIFQCDYQTHAQGFVVSIPFLKLASRELLTQYRIDQIQALARLARWPVVERCTAWDEGANHEGNKCSLPSGHEGPHQRTP